MIKKQNGKSCESPWQNLYRLRQSRMIHWIKFPTDGKKEYNLQQVTGKGKDNTLKTQDWDAACRAMLGVYHNQDFFSDEAGYRKLLQRHIRRGLREINVSWKSGSDFHAWLSHEFFSNLQSAPAEVTENQGPTGYRIFRNWHSSGNPCGIYRPSVDSL